MKRQQGFISALNGGAEEKIVAKDGSVSGETFETVGDFTAANPMVSVRDCNVFYGDTHAIQANISRHFRTGYSIVHAIYTAQKSRFTAAGRPDK